MWWQLVCHTRAPLLFDKPCVRRNWKALSLAVLHCPIEEISGEPGGGTFFPERTVHPRSATEWTAPKFGSRDSDGHCQVTTAVLSPLAPCLVSSEPKA